MASIEERNGKWRVRWRDPDGRARSRQVATKRTATKLAREVEDDVGQGRRWQPRDAGQTTDLNALMEAYLRDCARHLAPGTVRNRAYALEIFARFLREGHSDPARLEPSILSRNLLGAYYDSIASDGLHGKPRRDASRKKLVEIVQGMWTWAFESEDFEGEVPYPKKIKMRRPTRRRTIAPTWQEMDLCIGSASGWVRDAAYLLRYLGLRPHQVMALKWEHFNLTDATLWVPTGKTAHEKDGWLVPISHHVVDHIKSWRTFGRCSGYLVESKRTGAQARELRQRDFVRAWSRASVRTEVFERQSMKAFRKGFVSNLKKAGADVEAVEYLVGHSVGDVRGAYLDPNALPLREAVDLIPAVNFERTLSCLPAPV